jgi:hypothetical protein
MTVGTEHQVWVETWANRIETRGLAPVALSFLWVLDAFGFLVSQLLLVAQPLFASSATRNSTVERMAVLLEHPQLLEELRISLERKES